MSPSPSTPSKTRPDAEARAQADQAVAHADDARPEDPRFRIMRRLVNALLIVLIAGVLTIVAALVLALKQSASPPPPSTTAIPGLAPSDRLIEAQATESRITLLIEGADGQRRVVILDARTFRPLSSLSAP